MLLIVPINYKREKNSDGVGMFAIIKFNEEFFKITEAFVERKKKQKCKSTHLQ